MSQDIRSFFKVLPKKTDIPKPASAIKKKPKRIIDSDDEDVISATPETKVRKKPEKKQKIEILSSDSEDENFTKKASKKEKKQTVISSSDSEEIFRDKTRKKPEKKDSGPKQKPVRALEILSSDSEDVSKKKTPKKPENVPTLKPVNIADIFKNTPIKQSKVEIPQPQSVEKVEKQNKPKSKKRKNDIEAEKKVHNDQNFEMTLDDLDDDLFKDSNLDELEKTVSEVLQEEEKAKKTNVQEPEKQEDKNVRKRSRSDSTEKNTPKKKKKIEHSDSGIDPGQEAHEKRRYSAMLYQKYMSRGGPKNHGLKELPKGKPNCLNNLCFLKTGVLDSLESEEFNNLIKEHGGRVVQSVSKKVNYVVVGEDPGPAKMAKAEDLNIRTISEDELLDLILTKSGMKAKYCKKDNSGGSEDLGFETDNEPSSTTKKEVEKETHKTKELKEELKQSPKKQKENDNNKKEPETQSQEPKKSTVKEQNNSLTPKSFYSQPSTSKVIQDNRKHAPTYKTKVEEQNGLTTSSSHSQPTISKILPTTQKHDVLKTKHIEQDSSMLPLTEKYKPQTLKAVIGQQDERSNLYKLKQWLEKWHKNQDPNVKKTLIRPSPWAKSDDGAYFKCALLSGPPGVGKTTSATLVAKELGLDVVEFNASDTRSKRLLHEEVSQLLHTRSIAGFAAGQSNTHSKRVLLMDEVDGMAGNEDRGGIQELIQLIKNSSVPIVCMCNDRNHQKIRSLLNYCYDLKFAKPRLEQIRGAMMSVCFKENIDISVQALSEIIAGTGCDVRQTLNQLAMLGSTNEKISKETAEKEAKASKKDTIMGPWEVCRTVFTKSEHKDKSVADKARLFFFDYSLGPLFVQENYLKVQPDGLSKKQTLLRAALTASSISMGDVIDSKIRRSNNWALLESAAFFSSVMPGHYMSGSFTGQINFPGWLGKNSRKNKYKRMQSEIHTHIRVSASASKMAVKLDYVVPLRNAILTPLKKKGMEGIDEAVSVMKTYNLLREDVDSLIELCSWTPGENPMSSIPTKVKSAFTRAYNKQVTLLPYAPTSGVTKKKAEALDNELLGEEEEVVSDHEDEDDISKNAMIKVKKKSAGKGKKTDEEPGTSKKTETKKGKGKKTK